MISSRTCIVVAVLVSLAVACTQRKTGTTSLALAMLIVLPGAQDVKRTAEYDGTVSYRLSDPYPADNTLGQIRTRLENQGWKPDPNDIMNPDTKNSHDRGWMNFIDGTRNNANVFLWAAAWESPRGDRVEYWLRYEYAKDSGPMSERPPLQVSAMYMTAPTVNIIREDVRRRENAAPPIQALTQRHDASRSSLSDSFFV